MPGRHRARGPAGGGGGGTPRGRTGGRMALVNAQAEHLFGYRRDELVDQPAEISQRPRGGQGCPQADWPVTADETMKSTVRRFATFYGRLVPGCTEALDDLPDTAAVRAASAWTATPASRESGSGLSACSCLRAARCTRARPPAGRYRPAGTGPPG